MPDDGSFDVDLSAGGGVPTHPESSSPTEPVTPSRRFAPGTLIGGRYRLASMLGKGGMGEVYRAEDLRLGEDVALKFLPRAVANNPARRARFVAEARVARKLTHANLCRVHDFVEADGECFLSMELVEGEDLASLLRRIGRLPPDKALDVAQQICLGLEAAHERGVLHRDLKPANIMLDVKGRVRLMDFGLAALIHEVDREFAGTPRYMAPEQLAGGEVTPKSDLFALGLVLHEIFAGEYPGPDDFSDASLDAGHGDVHADVLRTIAACLHPDPRRRPRSAVAVAAALPGGDPLAAAVRAGEVPSPAMVAAAAGSDRVSARVAGLLGLAVIAALALRAFVTGGLSEEYGRAKWVRPPEALVDRAKDAVRALGYGPFAYEAAGIARDELYDDWLKHEGSGAARWKPLGDPIPPGAAVWFRAGPRPLLTAFAGFVPAPDDPPPSDGEVSCKVSLAGNLLAFRGRPGAPRAAPDAAGLDRAWADLFARAGLDRDRFKDAEPESRPPGQGAESRAWTGTVPGFETMPVRVEGASRGGAVTGFAVSWPWHARQPSSASDPLVTFRQIFDLSSFLAALVFAVRNLKKRRGDLRSAIRFGTFLTLCGTAFWLSTTNGLEARGGAFWLVSLGVGHALFGGLHGALMYLAIEPFVRRRLPHLLVGWTRVLDGRLVDPVVGRDVLIGSAASLLYAVVTAGTCGLGALGVTTTKPLSAINELRGLHGLRDGLGEVAWLLGWGPTAALLAALVFAAAFALLRRKGAAFALAVAVGTPICMVYAPFDSLAVAIVLGVVQVVLVMFVLVRFGILAAAVSLALPDDFPLALDPNAWFARFTLPLVAMTLAILWWGWRAATAPRSAAPATSSSGAGSG